MTTQKKSTLCLFILLGGAVSAQYFSPKIDLFSLLSSRQRVIRPSIEASFATHFSGALAYETGKFAFGDVEYTNKQRAEVYKVTGWGLVPELRYFPFTRNKPAPVGFFVGTYFRYRQLEEWYSGPDHVLSNQNRTVAASVRTTGISREYGLKVGYKQTLGHFVAETYLGIGSAGGEWATQNKREKIIPNYRTYLDRSLFVGLDISIGFIFPKYKANRVLSGVIPSVATTDPELQELATVIIYRRKKVFGCVISYKLYANDSLVAKISNGSYFKYTCPPGDVTFRAKTEASYSMTVNLEKGRTYYLRCDVRSGMFVVQPCFNFVAVDKGRKEANAIKNK